MKQGRSAEELTEFWRGRTRLALRRAEQAEAELALARAVVNAARASYDVNDYPAEEGDLYKAIAAYDNAVKARAE